MTKTRQRSTRRRPRIDDLFRYAVHARPAVALSIAAPDLFEDEEHVRVVRLDTQLAPSSLLPDCAYLVENSRRTLLVVMEGQSRWIQEDGARTTSVLRGMCDVAENSTDQAFGSRLIQMRTKERALTESTGLRRRVGDVHFEPCNALLDQNPADPLSSDPRRWAMLAFSRHVDPADIERMQFSCSQQLLAPVSHAPLIDSTDLHLLGAIGRARFPRYAWSRRSREITMNDIQNIENATSGQLTAEERHELQRQAILRARMESRLAQQEAQRAGEIAGRRAGEIAGRRAGESDGRNALLSIAASIAPDDLEHLRGITSLDELRDAVLAHIERSRQS